MMYKKGVAVELQFSAQRLQAPSTGPCTLGLTDAEARALYERLTARLAASSTAAPIIVTLEKNADVVANVAGNAAAPIADGQVMTDATHRTANATVAADATAAVAEHAAAEVAFKQWVCVICGWVYDEEAGLPEEGIAPGTRFEDIDDAWRCPLCDVGKEDFVVVEF